MDDDDWLKGEDSWIEDEKIRNLSIPGIALPGLRDLKIQFIALIYFDLFLGPVVYINEIQRGSSFITKLKDQRTISEVYAGVADVDVDELSNIDDNIAVFRYIVKKENAEDVKTILLISCLAGTDLDLVKELGKNALPRARGDPAVLGFELSKYMREKLNLVKKFKTEKISDKIVILDENRLKKPLEYDRIKGIMIVDYNARLADFRNFPQWLEGVEITEYSFLNFLDLLSSSILENKITSLIYQDNIILATKFDNENLFVVIAIEEDDITRLKKIAKCFIPYSKQLRAQWKLSSPEEIRLSLSFLDMAIHRGTVVEDLERYVNMILRSSKIIPTLNHNIEIDEQNNTSLDKDIWDKITAIDGEKSLLDISKDWGLSMIELIPPLEWCRLRELLIYYGD